MSEPVALAQPEAPPVDAAQTYESRLMIRILLRQESDLHAKLTQAKVSLRPIDLTADIVTAISAQSRALAFILDELLLMRGEGQSISFQADERKSLHV